MNETREEIIDYLRKHNPMFTEKKFERYPMEVLCELKRITELGVKAENITDQHRKK